MTQTWHVEIEGMTCGKCVATVDAVLDEIETITNVHVVLDHNLAYFDHVGDANDDMQRAVTDAIEEVGFDVLSISHGAGISDDELDDSIDANITNDITNDISNDSTNTSSTAQVVDEDDAGSVPDPASSSEHREGELVQIDVRGMTCASCVARVERALHEVDGAQDVRVNYATEVASLYVSSDIESSSIVGAIEGAGYEVESIRRQADAASAVDGVESSSNTPAGPERVSSRRAKEADVWRQRWVDGLKLTLPIMLIQMGPGWFSLSLDASLQMARMVLLTYLTALVMWSAGRGFFEGAWRGLKHRSVNMDTLVALGSGVAFGFSVLVAIGVWLGRPILGTHVYFDGAAMILTLIGVGKWLEARAKGKASEAIEALLDLGAKHATVRQGERWVNVPVERVALGDELLVRAGEKVPVDGVVIEGQASLDVSMMTGESVPVVVGIDGDVFGASINVDGRLVVRATRVGDETALANIIKRVEAAQGSKANVQALADKIASIFVPVVLVIAALTFLTWGISTGQWSAAVLPAIAVLVVACPCALGLAVPTALMVGSGLAAKQGIVVRDARALEQAQSIDTILFDKTGTLTTGHMVLGDVVTNDSIEDSDALAIASLLEAGSVHPIAEAIVAAADELSSSMTLAQFESFAGDGVSGVVDGNVYHLGKLSWVTETRMMSDALTQRAKQAQDDAQTVVALGDARDVLALFLLSDVPKTSARSVVQSFADRGVTVWMITGDTLQTAQAIAAEVGIAPEHIMAQVRPEDKAEHVATLQAQGRRVAMVGDGINDAPALAQADLGIAVGSGADVAMEAAGLTLIGEDLHLVVRAIDIAQATYRKIRQNLFWAFIYNIILIPIAALGGLIPALAAGAMAFSSVSVVSNSLLLQLHKSRI